MTAAVRLRLPVAEDRPAIRGQQLQFVAAGGFQCRNGHQAEAPAFRLGEKMADPLTMYLSDIFTISANLAGIPGISVPCGFTTGNLPIGLQLIGKHFDEETLLTASFAYEQSTEWHKRKPAL